MKKKIIIGVLIAALIAGGTAGGAVYYRKSHQSEVSVVSVDSLASQYYTDDTSLEGNIATSAVQSITIDKDMIVQDVYVSKGDTVKKGDKLVSFDMTLVQMELKIAKLKQEQQEQNLAKAQKRLASLQNGGPVEESDAAGFASAAQAYYNTKTDEHILRICKSSEIPRYIVFHEFTHILDTEMYAKQDSWKYMALSGYTEYHAAQVELMIMLGADSIQTQDFSFTVDVEIGNSTVRNYLNSRHQLVVNMMNRTDFPRDIEALKTTVGVLYNYFGVRSICKMYAKDYTEEVDNTIIIQKLSKVLFEEINSFMVGWFNEAQVELSFVSYMKIMWPMLQSYFGKE